MLDYHEVQARNSQWKHTQVRNLEVEPLDAKSPYFGNTAAFAGGISEEAVKDTAENLGLAIRIDGELYPVRSTAYKSLLDRAKIGGTALPKIDRGVLAQTLNACLKLFGSDALTLIRDEKVAAVHSGDAVDYSVLPIDALLRVLQSNLDARFPENEFEQGYSDHFISSATWKLPKQKEDLLGAYAKLLASQGKTKIADKLMPGMLAKIEEINRVEGFDPSPFAVDLVLRIRKTGRALITSNVRVATMTRKRGISTSI